MTDWQDISTAPKDGTWILAFCPLDRSSGEPRMWVIQWYVPQPMERYVPAAVDGLYRKVEVPYSDGWWHGAEVTPPPVTHWQPLPAGPSDRPIEKK